MPLVCGQGTAADRLYDSNGTYPTLPDGDVSYLTILEARYADGMPEKYFLPLSFLANKTGNELTDIPEKGRIGDVTIGEQDGLLIDAIYDERFRQALFTNIYGNSMVPQTDGTVDVLPG